jgi:ubiquinone/menaquinone biosynthesis C-methylase UbiE
MKNTELINEFSEFAEEYDQIVVDELGYTAHWRLPQKVIEQLGRGPAHVLDLGCGTGISSTLFFEQGYAVTGVDIAPGMIDQAKQHPFQKLLCQSLEAPLPLDSACFDAAVALGVLEFIQSPARFLQEVHRVLKPGGCFALTVPRDCPAESSLPVRSYRQREAEELLTAAGFAILSCESFLGYELDGERIQYWGYLLKVAR